MSFVSHVHHSLSHSHSTHARCFYSGIHEHVTNECWQRAYDHAKYMFSIYLTHNYFVPNQYGRKQM